MQAVVTGAAGFIGGHLAEALKSRGYRVTGIDREASPSVAIDRFISVDLSRPPSLTGLDEVMAGADVVFHLAARAGVRGHGPGLSVQRHRDNVVATRNVLAATPIGTHVVATSSSSVYGDASTRDGSCRPSRETDPVRPVGEYARSKVRMERLCAGRRERGGSITVLRPFSVVGERQRPDMAFAIWLEALRRGEPIILFGSEGRSRDITDVRDVVEGLVRSADARVDATVNLGTGAGHQLGDLARALIEVSGLGGDIVHTPVSREDVSATLADTTRCAALLGFIPKTDLHSVLDRLVSSRAPALAAP